jgi:hypothetical protein
MSRRIGDTLPGDLVQRLSGRGLEAVAEKVIVVCTVDEEGFPHPALLSYFEVIAIDRSTIRLATYSTSRTTANARRTGRLTLVIVDAHVAYYIKGLVQEIAPSMRVTPYNAKLQMRVADVLADEANPEFEPGAYIAGGIRYVNPRRAVELERAHLVLAELQE